MTAGRDLLDELPDETLVPVYWVRELLEADPPDDGRDLTTNEAAKILDRSPSSVRGWCASGEIDAYKFKNREWRIPHDALEAFRAQQRENGSGERTRHSALGSGRRTDPGAWRKVRELERGR